jgi:hypothetical protein
VKIDRDVTLSPRACPPTQRSAGSCARRPAATVPFRRTTSLALRQETGLEIERTTPSGQQSAPADPDEALDVPRDTLPSPPPDECAAAASPACPRHVGALSGT